MRRRRIGLQEARRVLAGAALTVLLSPLAHATVSSCTVSASGVAFGTYAADSPSALTSTGTISVACTVPSGSNAVTVALSTGSSGSFGTRTLTSGANSLIYNLYLNAVYTQLWGNGTSGTLTETTSVTHTQPRFTNTVYGQIPALQDVPAGTYTDTITVTVSY